MGGSPSLRATVWADSERPPPLLVFHGSLMPGRSSSVVVDSATGETENVPPGAGLEAAACELPAPDDSQIAAWEAAAKAGTCIHCKGDLDSFIDPLDGPFCCRGCRAVYELIHGSGLARYYDLQTGRQAPAATLRSGSFAWLDRELAEQGAVDSKKPFRLSLDIQGVHCAACIWLLEELFRREAGGLDLRINPTLGKVDLVWDPSAGDLRGYLLEIERFENALAHDA